MSLRSAAARAIASLCLVGMMAGSVPAHAELTEAQKNRLRAAVAGIAIAAAIKKAKKERDREREWNRYERNGRHYYDYDWGRSFSPHNGVICYQRTRQCFKNDHYSAKWTARSFH